MVQDFVQHQYNGFSEWWSAYGWFPFDSPLNNPEGYAILRIGGPKWRELNGSRFDHPLSSLGGTLGQKNGGGAPFKGLWSYGGIYRSYERHILQNPCRQMMLEP